MTGCFVNIRGVEHPDKQRFLRETIREEGAFFIGLSDTIKSNYTPNWFKKITGNKKKSRKVSLQLEDLEGFFLD
jgi:hypothetical protein